MGSLDRTPAATKWRIALAGLLIVLSACAAQRPDPAMTAQEIDRMMSEEYPAGGPGAAVLISKAGSVILKKGYGLADVEHQTPVTPQTVFRLASMTKIFTSTAILMLAEQGKLSLGDPISKFFPDWPASGRDITVRHLLTHTSGLAEYLDRPDFMDWVRNEYTVEELLSSFRDKPSSFAPGEKNAYCNSNYILLGAIIERVSGVGFAEFVKANIFDPVGMKSTFCCCSLENVPLLAEAYEPARTEGNGQDWEHLGVARPYTLSSVYAAGGCLSSVEDLFLFHEALLKGRLLNRESLAQSFEPVALNDGSKGNTGYGGWQLDNINAHRAAMRGGSMPGVCTWFITMPDDSMAVILLSNRTPGKPRCGMLAVKLAGVAIGK